MPPYTTCMYTTALLRIPENILSSYMYLDISMDYACRVLRDPFVNEIGLNLR
jgi:hypothetical protein